jgi:hypothetical protein
MSHSTDLGHLLAQNERQVAAAKAAEDATHELARAANGNGGHVTPAPTVYEILGNLKVMMWQLREVTDFLPRGLAYSLQDDRLAVYDRDIYGTGGDRQPAAQVGVAAEHLAAISTALRAAAEHAESAQQALAGQGFNETN